MCSGAMVLFGIKRCVMGENETFVGGESILKAHGVEVVNLNLDSCKKLMADFIKAKPEVWNEVRPSTNCYLGNTCRSSTFVGTGYWRDLNERILRQDQQKHN